MLSLRPVRLMAIKFLNNVIVDIFFLNLYHYIMISLLDIDTWEILIIIKNLWWGLHVFIVSLKTKVKYFFKGNYFNLQVVSNTCKSLIYGLMVIVLALFDEDTLGELPVSTATYTTLSSILCMFLIWFCHTHWFNPLTPKI